MYFYILDLLFLDRIKEIAVCDFFDMIIGKQRSDDHIHQKQDNEDHKIIPV